MKPIDKCSCDESNHLRAALAAIWAEALASGNARITDLCVAAARLEPLPTAMPAPPVSTHVEREEAMIRRLDRGETW